MKLFKTIDTAYNNFDNTVKTYLQKTFGNLGMNYTHNQIFGVIYDGIKGVMQNAMFYIEDALTEQNIYTATRKKSIYNLAKISGYEPYYGSAATGTIVANTFVTNTTNLSSTKVYVKDGTVLINKATGLSYTLMIPGDEYVFDISKPLVKHEFKIVQGTWKTSKFVGVGNNFETFNLNSTTLFDKQYIKVYVNGIEYKQVANIYDMSENGEEYSVSIGFDNSFDITFGNGVYGKKINEGDIVTVSFITHNGESGNISQNETINFSFESSCYNGYGNTINGNDYINLTLTAPISGGNDADSIDTVKKLIGYNSRSLVLASIDNFRMFLNRFSFIGRSNIFSESNSLTVTATCLANVTDKIQSPEEYLELNESDLLLNESQKQMIITTLDNSKRTFAGMKFEFQDPIIRKYAGICYVKITDLYNKDVIKTAIRNSIADYFMNLPENTIFIPKSDIIKKVIDDNSSLIESFDIDFISELNEQAFYNGSYEKYTQKLINGVYKYVPTTTMYESNTSPGLDDYGNIQLNSNIEIPLFHGGFNYYPNKDTNDKDTSIRLDTLQILFI